MILSCESVDFVSDQLKLTFLLNEIFLCIFISKKCKFVFLLFFHTAIFVDGQKNLPNSVMLPIGPKLLFNLEIELIRLVL